jgi:hypothetical protein
MNSAERICWIDRQMADRKNVSGGTLIKGDAYRRESTVTSEKALHGMGRHVNPDPAIQLHDSRNPDLLDRGGDGSVKKLLTAIQKDHALHGTC